MKFIRLEYKNNVITTAELDGYQEIINENVKNGHKYIGYIPVKLGPSGKILAIDLIFE